MHLPPAVSYEVVRSKWHLFIGGALITLAVAGTACFWVQQVVSLGSTCLACIVVVSATASFLAWCRTPVGLQQWDGAQWLWPEFGDVPVQSVNLFLDLQVSVLFELKSVTGKTTRLFLEQRFKFANWLALRRAIVVQVPRLVNPEAELRISAEIDT
jgi:hypothetical protein